MRQTDCSLFYAMMLLGSPNILDRAKILEINNGGHRCCLAITHEECGENLLALCNSSQNVSGGLVTSNRRTRVTLLD